MNERAPIFTREFPNDLPPGTERLRLPEFMEINVEREGGALDAMVAEIRALGVDDATIKRYRAAVRDFAVNRPSEVVTTERLSFEPKLDYFGLHLRVPATFQVIERLAAKWKPRLGQEGMSVTRINGAEVFAQMQEDWPTKPEHLSPAINKFLTELNRLQYSLHDPIHVLQGVATGDRLNRYKEQFDPDGTLFDEEAERLFILASRPAVDQFLEDWDTSAPLPYSPVSESPDSVANGRRGFSVIWDNEAMMDTLSERQLRPVLREQPAVCLWLHNRVTYLATMLRELNRQILTGRTEIPANVALFVGQGALDSLTFVAQNYFTAFDSTTEAEAFLREPKTVLGRPLSGTVLAGPAMTRVDLINLVSETRAHFKRAPLSTYTYPSGETHRYGNTTWSPDGVDYAAYPPISNRGVELAADIFERAAEGDRSGKRVQDALYKLQRVLERPNTTDSEIGRATERLNEDLGTSLSSQDGKELFGISAYVSVRSFDPEIYPRALAVRKAVYDRLRTKHPDRVKKAVQDLFLDSSETPVETDYLLLTGFGWVFDPLFGGEPAVQRAEWSNVREDRKLGAMGIDMTRLSSADLARVRQLYENSRRPNDITAELTRAMELFKELKQKQT